MARALVQEVGKAPLDCLVMEGTHFNAERQRGMSEHELEDYLVREMRLAPGLALAAFSPMHVDRLVTFYKAARRCGRTFVLDAYSAYVMHLASGQTAIPRPTAGNNICVFYHDSFRQMRRRFESRAAQTNKPLPKLYDLFDHNRIGLAEILAEPARCAMIFRPSMIERDFDGQIPPNATCFYSYWHGYLEKPELQQAQKQLAAAGGRIINAHTSGHIFAEDILKFVRELKPARVVPIHTAIPETFTDRLENVVVLSDGEILDLNKHSS